MPTARYACRPTLLYHNVSGMSGSVSDPHSPRHAARPKFNVSASAHIDQYGSSLY